MSVDELASIGITPDSMKAAIMGSHKGWLIGDGRIVQLRETPVTAHSVS